MTSACSSENDEIDLRKMIELIGSIALIVAHAIRIPNRIMYRLQYRKSNCISRNLKSLSFKGFKLVKCGTKVK